jgi:hypothetical protein
MSVKASWPNVIACAQNATERPLTAAVAAQRDYAGVGCDR